MKFTVDRDKLLATLQKVSGVVERRSSQPVLSHVLLQLTSHQLRVTGTDLEVEICSLMTLAEPAQSGEITVPARKLLDICRALPEGVELAFTVKDEKVTVKTGKSRFSLATLPVESFPKFELTKGQLEFSLEKSMLKDMLDRTLFSVAQQDVRFYLNGLLLQIKDGMLYAVATDGHRLAMFKSELNDIADYEVIIPRKGVTELVRLLDSDDDFVDIKITDKHIMVKSENFSFISKKIEGRFPDYKAVLPKDANKIITCDRDDLKNALSRVSILTNEKYRGVQLQLRLGVMVLSSKNPEHEEAEEELSLEYAGENFEIGFNVGYLLDILNHIPAGDVQLSFVDTTSSVLIKSLSDVYNCLYVVMPVRI